MNQRTRRFVLVAGVLLLALLITACNDDSTNPSAESDPLAELKAQLAQTPRKDVQAEGMALWVSGALVAPEAVYQEFNWGLRDLKSEFAREVPLLWEMPFIAPRQPSAVKLSFDSFGKQRILYGQYDDWDSLNALFRMTRMDTTRLRTYLWVTIRFKGLVNSDSLVSYYERLPNVSSAWGIPYIGMGDYGNLFPNRTDDGLRFLLRGAGGDCPSGCTENHFWYFAQHGEDWELVGDFEDNFPEPPPDWWWEEATDLFCSFKDWTTLCRD